MASGGLDQRYRRLLFCYPRAWRGEHGDEMVSVLLDQADEEQRSRVGVREAFDLVAHGLEARLDALLRRLPERLRRQTASVALVMAAGIALLLLVGEVVGARHRPPAEELVYSRYFSSGPFLTIGVGLYLAYMTAALLVVLARPGVARLLLLAGSAYAVLMLAAAGTADYPVPRVPLLLMCVGLGLLASLTTLDLDRRARRRLVGAGAGFVTAVCIGLLLTKPLLVWGIGTMTSSGNVALAALAAALPVVSGGGLMVSAVLVALSRVRVSADWSAATAIAAFPLVVYCSVVSILVNPVQAPTRALIPVLYVLVVAVVARVVKRRRRTALAL